VEKRERVNLKVKFKDCGETKVNYGGEIKCK